MASKRLDRKQAEAVLRVSSKLLAQLLAEDQFLTRIDSQEVARIALSLSEFATKVRRGYNLPPALPRSRA